MFSQWAVGLLKRLLANLAPYVRQGQPVRALANGLFAVSVFCWFNRRPFSSYNTSFWSQLLYLVRLFKLVYLLRFLMVEMVFRQLKALFAYLSPLVIHLSVGKRLQADDSCLMKVVNLAFCLLFLCINVSVAFCAEWAIRVACGGLKTAGGWARVSWTTPVACTASQRRRQRQKRAKHRSRRSPRSSTATRSLFNFWPGRGQRFTNVHPTLSPSMGVASTSSSCSVGGAGEVTDRRVRRTRSGRQY